MGCNYLSLPEILASGNKVLIDNHVNLDMSSNRVRSPRANFDYSISPFKPCRKNTYIYLKKTWTKYCLWNVKIVLIGDLVRTGTMSADTMLPSTSPSIPEYTGIGPVAAVLYCVSMNHNGPYSYVYAHGRVTIQSLLNITQRKVNLISLLTNPRGFTPINFF